MDVDKVVTGIVPPQEEFLTMMQPFDQMSAKLSGAPMTISVLGQLCAVATGVEVDLRVEGITEKYQYLTHPSSLRACLMQVSQSAYGAFRKADSNMEYISMSCEKVPGLMKMALTVLLSPKSSPEDVQDFLPNKLKAIKKVADDACIKCDEVVNKFEHVIKVIEEVQLGSIAKQSDVKTALEKLAINIENSKHESERLVSVARANEKRLKDMEVQVSKAKDDWKDAIAAMPSAGELMLGALTDGITTLISMGTNAAAKVAGAVNVRNGSTSSVPNDEYEGADFSLDEYMVKTRQINVFANLMLNYFDDSEDDLTLRERVIEKGDSEIPVGNILEAETFFQMKKKQIQTMETGKHKATKLQLLKVTAAALKVCKELKKLPEDVNVIKRLQAEVDQIISTTDTLDSGLKMKAGVSQFNKPNPTQQGSSGNSSSSTCQAMIDNAHKKVEANRAELNSVRQQAELEKKRFDASQEALAKGLKELENFKNEDATSKDIIEVLNKGLQALNQVKEQWAELLQFFTSMSNLINSTMAPALNMFVEDTEKVSKKKSISDMAKEMVYQTAFSAVKVNHVVKHLAGSYGEISKKHLMPLCFKLDEILVLDKDKDKELILMLRAELGKECREAQEDIKAIVDQHHNEFLENCVKKTTAIDTQIKAIAPISEERKQTIRSNAQKMVDAKENDKEAEIEFDF